MLKKLIKTGVIINLLLLMFFFNYTGSDIGSWAVRTLENIDIVSENVVDRGWQLSGEDMLEFSFENRFVSLEQMVLRFDGMKGHENGVMQVSLSGEEEAYYLYEIPLCVFEDELFYLSMTQIKPPLNKEMCRLRISVSGLGEECIYLSASTDDFIGINGADTKFPVIHVSGTEWTWNRQAVTRGILCILAMNLIVVVLALIIWQSGKKGILHAGLFLVGTGVVAGMLLFFPQEELVKNRTVVQWSANVVPQITTVPLKNGELQQKFSPQYDIISKLYLFLDNVSSKDTAMLSVSLEDKRGNVIDSGQVCTGNMGNDSFCYVFYPQSKLKKGREYILRVGLDTPDSDITVRALRGSKLHPSMGELRVENVVQEDAGLYFSLEYQVGYFYPFIGIATLGFSLLCYFIALRYPSLCKYMRRGITCLIPLICFAGIELLSGNLGMTENIPAINNVFILATILLLIRMPLGRYADYVMLVLSFIMGTVNHYVLKTRGMEFLFTDIRSFSTAMTVVGNYDISMDAVVYLAAFVMLVVIIMGIFMDRRDEWKKSKKERYVTAAIGTMATVTFSAFLLPASSISQQDISKSLQRKGWFYGNICLLKVSGVSKPHGYSEEQVESILEKYIVEEEKETEIVPENIIVIMNEAFSDIQVLGDLKLSEDPLAFINSLTENTIQGKLHVPTRGGNTCLTEYEFLTGNAMHFIPQGTIPYMVLCGKEEPGISSVLGAQGFHTVAMHPYRGENWNRDEVYEAMGFQEFLDIESFEGAETIRGFVSDKANYDKIIEYYENLSAEEKLFIFNVTMQNHGGYDVNNGRIERTVFVDNIESEIAENYLSLIKETDKAFEYLIDYFSEVAEPTMIVMFGDHQPSFTSAFYEELYELSGTGQNQDENQRNQYITKYIIWTNYDSDFTVVPEMSSNYLASFVLQCAGTEMADYQKFQLQFMKEYPVVGKYGAMNGEGSYFVYDEETEKLLTDYRMLQYMRIKDRKGKKQLIFNIPK